MQRVEFNVNTITLGELDALEQACGQDPFALMQRRSGLLMAAVFLAELRASGKRLSWNELSSRTLIDSTSSPSPSEPDGPPPSAQT